MEFVASPARTGCVPVVSATRMPVLFDIMTFTERYIDR
jgi:hypothetical protein